MKKVNILAAAMLAVGIFAFSSCSRDDKREAADDLQDAQEKVENKADDVAEDIKDATNETAEEIDGNQHCCRLGIEFRDPSWIVERGGANHRIQRALPDSVYGSRQ